MNGKRLKTLVLAIVGIVTFSHMLVVHSQLAELRDIVNDIQDTADKKLRYSRDIEDIAEQTFEKAEEASSEAFGNKCYTCPTNY